MIKVKRIEKVRRAKCLIVAGACALAEIFLAMFFILDWVLFLYSEQKLPGRGYPLLIGSVACFFGWKLMQSFGKRGVEEIKEPTDDP